MSVKIQDITKIYGEQKAVDSINFEVNKGEVLGFLGPNGAGKTTTMKIITCFIPQTSGTAEVCGFDTRKNPMEVRRLIGYLPEHNPLYKEMYVKEYLNFIGRLHKLPNRKQRIEEMVEMTGLTREQYKPIGALSKGYRQRVGLAQAMLHDPEVLILDEPTSGLDPNQLVEIRNLIKTFGKDKTIIFSTHIMQEVKALCDRVLIIDKGQIVANDSMDQLQTKFRESITIVVEFLEKTNQAALKSIEGVVNVKQLNNRQWLIATDKEKDLRPDIFKFAVKNGLTLLEMQKKVADVEDVFQELTQNKSK